MHESSTAIFPSITPAATASIVTGVYPAQHGIVGASWYDRTHDRVAYYGDDFWTIAAKGFGAFLRDFLVHLNGDRLTAPTLFERLERNGRKAACVNYIVFRGLVAHRVNMPWLLAALPGVPFTMDVMGPSTLYLGDFVSPRARDIAEPDRRGGPLHRLGMDDASTGAVLLEMVASDALPDFTVAYFADNDYASHEVGSAAALSVVEQVDATLHAMFDAAGGFEKFAAGTCVVITSDHGHSDILTDDASAAIELDDVLCDFARGSPGAGWGARDEMLVCPNMRAAQIYLRTASAVLHDRVTRALARDPRIDLVLWRDGEGGNGQGTYTAMCSGATLTFSRSAPLANEARDAFGTRWRWSGDLAVLAMRGDEGCLESTEYPNAFERIAGALAAEDAGHVWATARPGHEFRTSGGEPHVGGSSHGSLHADDSNTPLIVSGGFGNLPSNMRSIDVAPLCANACDVRLF